MIVDRKEFKKFWKSKLFVPYIIFCNDKYSILSLEEIDYIINLYKEYLFKNKIVSNNNWDCSKFAMLFKHIGDLYHRQKDDGSHLAIGVTHIKLPRENYDHALNLIFFYDKDKNLRYTFFEPQNFTLKEDKDMFKNIEFLYF